MSLSRREPKKNDLVWIEGTVMPNGYIKAINWEENEVYVQHYDTDNETVLDLDVLRYSEFNERLNQWQVRAL